MLDIAKLKKNDFKALLQIVQTKMKLGIINDGCYEQKTWVKAEGGVSIFAMPEVKSVLSTPVDAPLALAVGWPWRLVVERAMKSLGLPLARNEWLT